MLLFFLMGSKDTKDEDVADCDSFSAFIQQEYQRRKERNPKYSLRSFARKLQLDQSLLSKIIQGKRSLSLMAMNLCLKNLGIDETELQEYLTKFSKKNRYHRPLDEEVFEVISEWHHFAIIELFKLKGVDHSIRSLSQRLNVSQAKIEEAVGRLERFEFITFNNGRYELTKPNNTWTSHTVTSEARKKLQKELLLKSIEALENIPIEDRHHSSFTFALSKNKLQHIKEKIFDLALQIGNFADQVDDFDEVYQLTLSLYPLTKQGDSQ